MRIIETIIALTPKLYCYQGHGCLFLTPKKPMLLCSLNPPEAGEVADEVPRATFV